MIHITLNEIVRKWVAWKKSWRKKNGSRSTDKSAFRLPLHLIWDCDPLAKLASAFLVSGFRANISVFCSPFRRLRFGTSVSNVILVQSPDDFLSQNSSSLRLCFSGSVQSSIKRSVYHSCK